MNRNSTPEAHAWSHSDLCAFVLGDLDEATGARMAAAATACPALRQEMERVRATVAAVERAFAGSEALPRERRAALISAAQGMARRRRRPVWPRIAAAAAVLCIALGLRGLKEDAHPRGAGSVDGAADRSSGPPAPGLQDLAGFEVRGAAEPTPFPSHGVVRLDDGTLLRWSRDADRHNASAGQEASQSPSLPAPIEAPLPAAEVVLALQTLARSAPPAAQDAAARVLSTSASLRHEQGSLLLHQLDAYLPGILIDGAEPLPRRFQHVFRAVDASPVFSPELARLFPMGTFTVIPSPPLSADALIASCRRQPGETPGMMFFRFWGDNAVERTALRAVSTFAADVDTASYALARAYLATGRIPPKEAIRTEEFVNYFAPDVAPPDAGTLRLHLECAPSLFGGGEGERWLLRVTLRGRDVPRGERLPQRLVLVVDTSGSMKEGGRLELVKHGLRLLASQLDERDQVALVTFHSQAEQRLGWTSATERTRLESVIHELVPEGSTNAAAGLELGYGLAAQAAVPGAVTRVVLLSDGVANVGETDQQRILDRVAHHRAGGIYLNTLGVGLGNHHDASLEQLADRGDGACNYVDDAAEARRALVDNFLGATVPIARDVKVQVEFEPDRVVCWRQLGYENRALAAEDFRNDAVDGGEIGAGHQVCALYEIEPVADFARSAPFVTARVRWLPPFGQGDEARELSTALTGSQVAQAFAAASAGYRRAALVAQFAELLRRSVHARGDSLDLLLHEALGLERELRDPDFTAFCRLLEQSRSLIAAGALAGADPLRDAVDALRRNAVLRAQLEDLAAEDDQDLLRRLEQENAELERRIRERLERGRR